jgi:hypothetical protein
MIVKNAESRLQNAMQRYKEPNWSPTNDEIHIFSVLTSILFIYDPIGVQNALDFKFSLDNIYDEYDIEAAALMRCRQQWPDGDCLGHAIKEVIDHYFAESYPWTDCFFLAKHAMRSIANKEVSLDIEKIGKLLNNRRHKWIKIEVD